MRLYASKVTPIVDSIVRGLVETGELETSEREEFKADVESILKEYLRANRDITERAKDMLEARGLAYSELYRIRRQLAEEQDFGIGDEAVTWIANQLIEMFMRSNWGRVMGIIACAFMLLRIPIGTIIGIMGLVAFIKAKELFGPDRITHAEVKRAFKQAKRERKQARRG